mgnify:CR=1 FL=1
MNFKYYLILSLLLIIPMSLYGDDENTLITSIHYIGRKHTPLEQLPPTSNLSSQQFRKLSLNKVNKDIHTLYQSGYFHEVSFKSTQVPNGIQLQFLLQENPVISNIEFIGNSLFSDDILNTYLSNKRQHPLNINTLKSDKENIEQFYHQKGYELSQVTKMQLNKENILQITLSEGNFKKIQFQGLHYLPDTFLRRYLPRKSNEKFNSQQLLKNRDRLLKTGYFSYISPPKLSQTRDGVLATFQVKEKKRSQLSLGLETESEQFLGFLQTSSSHRITPGDMSSAKVQIGQEDNQLQITRYQASYYQPWTFNYLPISSQINIWKSIQQEIYLSSDSGVAESTPINTQREGASFRMTIPPTHRPLTLQLKYRHDRISGYQNTELSPYIINAIGSTLSFQSTQYISNPQRGHFWQIELEKGGDIGITTLQGLNFSQLSFNNRLFLPLYESVILGINTTIGVFEPNQGNIKTIETEQYRLGGAYSLRGLKDNHYELTGTRKVLNNIELRWQVLKNLQSVFFIDIGHAFDKGPIPTFSDFSQGKGIGFRIFTPVGAIRLDLGLSQTDPILHFGLGQLF